MRNSAGVYPLWWWNPRARRWLIRHYGPARFDHPVARYGDSFELALANAQQAHPDQFRAGSIGLTLREINNLRTETAIAGLTTSVAVFDGERLYRYYLSRHWSLDVPLVVLMLNPSTADAFANDRTVARIEQRARQEGYGGYIVLNMAALRSTKPTGLKLVDDPVGPYNLSVIKQVLDQISDRWCMTPDLLLAFGGDVLKFPQLKQQLTRTLCACNARAHMVYLALTQHGIPRHPLYLRGDLTLQDLVDGSTEHRRLLRLSTERQTSRP